MTRYAGMVRLRVAIYGILASVFLVHTHAQNVGSGPLLGGERNPLYLQFYVPRAEPAHLTPKAKWRFQLGSAFANVFEREQNTAYTQDLDLEILINDLVVRHGVTTRLEVGLAVPFYSYQEGILDGTIQAYHDFFGLPDGSRDDVPNNRFSFLLEDASGQLLADYERRRFDLGEARVHFKYGWRPNLSLRAVLKVPTGGSGSGSGRLDAGLELMARRDLGRYKLHGHVGLVWLNPPSYLDPIVRRQALYAMGAFERPLHTRLSLLVQLDGGSAYFENTGLSNLEKIPLNLVVGLAGRFADGTRWQAGFAEDLSAEGPSVDFSIDFRIIWER